MTADDLMRLVNRYTEACDDLGAGLFNQTEAETNAKHAKAKELHGQILAEVYRLHAVAEKSERHVTIEAAHAMGASGAEGAGIEHSEPERLAFEAWKGAREDMAIWKRRALEAEELNRKFMATINGPTFMGEPAPAAVPAGWIACSERMPADKTPVLILRDNGQFYIGELRWDVPGHEDTFKAYRYWDDPNDDGQCWEHDSVTHWMPLPDAPEVPR